MLWLNTIKTMILQWKIKNEESFLISHLDFYRVQNKLQALDIKLEYKAYGA